MKFKSFDWYCWFITFLVLSFLFMIFFYGYWGLGLYINLSCFSIVNNFNFVFDYVSLYLSVLSMLLCLSVIYFVEFLTCRSVFYVILSVVASLLCYMSNNVFFFWWFYEVSILSLLLLLIVESPYSERFLAGWYLSGYVVLTSLPMLLCLVYFVSVNGSYFLSDWCFSIGLTGLDISLLVLLGILFITKIPLPPFHVWLPIVHAESTSVVSVCLSGYIMKLGLLGVCRFCWWVLPTSLLNVSYVIIVFSMSLFFFLLAAWELDGKRWLAFLSLSHIVICVLCLYSCDYSNVGLLYLFSLGHGLSAGLIFIELWLGSELVGSRNWMLLKSVFGLNVCMRFILCLGLCTVASLPPVVQFFVEISVLGSICNNSFMLFLIFMCYLFLSSLTPFFLLGYMFVRPYSVMVNYNLEKSGLYIISVFLVVWCFVLFFSF